MRTSTTKKFSNILSFILLFCFTTGFSFYSKACSPLVVPNLLSQSISGGDLLLNWESQNTYVCPGYSVEVEIVCLNASFTGLAPFFVSPSLNKTVSTPMAYPQQTISLSNFCPGLVYQFRGREIQGGSFSGWSSSFTFTVPGTFVPPTVNANASNNIICPPQTSQLNASIVNACGTSAYTYVWTPATGLSNPNIANPVASPTVSTSYTVVVTGGKFGCWTVSGVVNINTGLIPPAVGNGSAVPPVVCINKPTKLVLSSFTGNIQWQSAATNAGPWTDIAGAVTNSYVTAPVSANTCFQAVVTSCTGTIISNPFCVTINQIPVLTPTVMQISCSNTIATANMGNPGTSGSPLTVTWSPAPNSLASQSTIATYTLPGVVTLTVTFPDGCVSLTSLTIAPPPPAPEFTITNVTGSPSITCTYPTITLVASNNYTYGTPTYFWSSNTFTASTQTVTLSTQGNYSVTVFDPVTFCSVTHSLPVYVNTVTPVSTVNPVNQSISCGPGVVATVTGTALSPTVNVQHSWYAPGLSGAPVSANGVTSIYNPIVGTTTYVVTNLVTGCITTKTIQVLSIGGSYPTFAVTSNSTANTFTLGCATRSITDINIINANTTPPGGSLSYTLLPPAYTGTNYATNAAANVYTVNSPGNYILIVKDNNNQCETRLLLPVVQNTFGPNVVTSAVTQTLSCNVPTVSLQGTSTNSNVTFSWKSNGTPPVFPGAFLTVSTTSAGASVSSATLIDTYTLTVVDATSLGNHCPTSTIVTMYQNTRPPKAAIAGATPITCVTYSVNLTNDSKSGVLPGTFFGTQPIIGLLWEGPTPQVPQANSSTYLGFTAGIYTMTAKDLNNGCTSMTTTTLNDARVYPVITVPKTFTLDCGASSLTVSATFLPTTGLKYQWNAPPGASIGTSTNAVLLANSPGEYQIVATSFTNGCSSYSLVNVVNGSLFGNFEPDATAGYAPLTVNFTNNSASSLNSSSITSVWSFGNGAVRTTTTNVSTSALYQQAGTYTVTMFASKGTCLDTVVKIIKVDIASKLEVPNVFTPNGDNANDLFFVKTANLIDISASIFDRWGNKIYELSTEKGNIAWDGKNQAGKEAPDGTYFYVIKATGRDGQTYDAKGTVSLFR